MAKKRYVILNKKGNIKDIAAKYNIDPIVAKVIVNRNVEEDEVDSFLKPTKNDLHDPFIFKDMDGAVKMITEHILKGNKICVVADYDVDGVCSSYIMSDYIKTLGGNVVVYIPNRTTEGYGIGNYHVDRAIQDDCKLIITVDNGIAAIDTINYAREKDLDVIVTDHHEVQKDDNGDYAIPNANYIINHKMPDCEYPFKDLCGAGIAFKVCFALDEYVKRTLGSSFSSRFNEYIQFTALATVCDIVSLTGENRVMVKMGMKLMEHTQNIGLRCLLMANGRWGKKLDSYVFSFIIGPCINSSGRLETAQMALDLFNCKDEEKAAIMAGEIYDLNQQRKSMNEAFTRQGINMAKDMTEHIIVLYLPECHESLAGIVAGKIREEYYKPVIVFAGEENDGNIKGSARSIETYDMFEGISQVKDLTVKFGGHKMAAGLTIKKADLDEFRARINSLSNLTEEDFIEKIKLDGKFEIDTISEKIINDLELLEPFGKDNNKPSFGAEQIKVKKITIFGANNNVLRYELEAKSGRIVKGVQFADAFAMIDYLKENYGEESVTNALAGRNSDLVVSFRYYPSINDYNGYRSVQLVINEFIIK